MPRVEVCVSSVVLLENDLLAIEAHPFEDRADVIHHRLQAADVDVQVAPLADRFEQMSLHVPCPTAPGRFRTAHRRPETEVGKLFPKSFEVVAIVNGSLVPHSE